MNLGSHFVNISFFPSALLTPHQKNTNALHSWVPGYTILQRGYTGVIGLLKMDVKTCSLRRNTHWELSYAQDLALSAYLSWCIINSTPKEHECTGFVDTWIHHSPKGVHWCNLSFENRNQNQPSPKECTLGALMYPRSCSVNVSSLQSLNSLLFPYHIN